MSFQQGLSGLDAASKQLNVIGNNVANANTVGFKSSRAEFGDLYANSFYGLASTQAGIGVQTMSVTQQMTQGNLITSNNNLDLAINNNGFFVVSDSTGGSSGTLRYTRNGEFQVDRNGFVVNNGDQLQGWPASNGVIVQGPLSSLQLQTALISPHATTNMAMGINVDSRDTVPALTFAPTNPLSYNWSNSASLYDSLGNAHNLTLYYVKNTPTGTGTNWTVYPYVDGTAASTQGATPAANFTLNFSTTGLLTTSMPIGLSAAVSVGAVSPVLFNLDYSNSTQFAQNSGTNSLTNDGYATGTLSSMNISNTGVIQATYSNGQTNTIGQIALANFTNQQGLQPLGNNRWEETFNSGPSQLNAPGSGTVGTIRASALESSNVDLTTELVNMITAQRYYQANAQTIKTQDAVLQTLVNL